jgi:hypothetical protein
VNAVCTSLCSFRNIGQKHESQPPQFAYLEDKIKGYVILTNSTVTKRSCSDPVSRISEKYDTSLSSNVAGPRNDPETPQSIGGFHIEVGFFHHFLHVGELSRALALSRESYPVENRRDCPHEGTAPMAAQDWTVPENGKVAIALWVHRPRTNSTKNVLRE